MKNAGFVLALRALKKVLEECGKEAALEIIDEMIEDAGGKKS